MAFSEGVCDRALWMMASLSPLARRRLETEDYRHHLLVDEDGKEEQMYDILQSVLHELETIGISYAEPVETILQSDLTLEQFLSLMGYIFPSSLYLWLRDDKTLQHGLYCLTDGSCSDGDLLKEYLEYLYIYDTDLQRSIDYYKDKLVGSALFTDYLQGLQTHIGEQHIQPFVDWSRIDQVSYFIQRLEWGVEGLLKGKITTNYSYQDTVKIITNLTKDPDYAQRLGTWLELRYNTLPKAYRPFYLRLAKSLMITIPLSEIFFTGRGMEDVRSTEDKIISLALLGFACRKYGKKRLYKQFPDNKDYIDRVFGVMIDVENNQE